MAPSVIDRGEEIDSSKDKVDAVLKKIERDTARKDEWERQQASARRASSPTPSNDQNPDDWTDKYTEGMNPRQRARFKKSAGRSGQTEDQYLDNWMDKHAKGLSPEERAKFKASAAAGNGNAPGKTGGTSSGGAAGQAALQALKRGEGVEGIAQSAASAWIVNGALLSLLDPTLTWGSLCLIYLNIHLILSKFGVKWFRPMAMWQAAIVIIADLLIICLAALIITVPLIIIHVGCSPEALIGDNILGNIVGYISRTVVMPPGLCEAFAGLAKVAATAVEYGVAGMCSSPEILAQRTGALYPSDEDPDLDRLIQCIEGRVSNPGPKYTFEQNNGFCNASRGAEEYEVSCGKCAHAENSCHYGGASGETGSLAVDFDFPASGAVIGPQILQAAIACSSSLGIPLKRSVCENDNGEDIPCARADASHTHTSIAKCDRDNNKINSE